MFDTQLQDMIKVHIEIDFIREVGPFSIVQLYLYLQIFCAKFHHGKDIVLTLSVLRTDTPL